MPEPYIVQKISDRIYLVQCAYCGGKGRPPKETRDWEITAFHQSTCRLCDGKGVLKVEIDRNDRLIECVRCDGSGHRYQSIPSPAAAIQEPCQLCKGMGIRALTGSVRNVDPAAWAREHDAPRRIPFSLTPTFGWTQGYEGHWWYSWWPVKPFEIPLPGNWAEEHPGEMPFDGFLPQPKDGPQPKDYDDMNELYRVHREWALAELAKEYEPPIEDFHKSFPGGPADPGWIATYNGWRASRTAYTDELFAWISFYENYYWPLLRELKYGPGINDT